MPRSCFAEAFEPPTLIAEQGHPTPCLLDEIEIHLVVCWTSYLRHLFLQPREKDTLHKYMSSEFRFSRIRFFPHTKVIWAPSGASYAPPETPTKTLEGCGKSHESLLHCGTAAL